MFEQADCNSTLQRNASFLDDSKGRPDFHPLWRCARPRGAGLVVARDQAGVGTQSVGAAWSLARKSRQIDDAAFEIQTKAIYELFLFGLKQRIHGTY